MKNEMPSRFVMWGAGHLGTQLYSFCRAGQVVAVIDRNPKINGAWNGIPVISLSAYTQQYSAYPLVITPVEQESIIAILRKHGISNFLSLASVFPPSAFYPYLPGSRVSYEEILRRVQNANCPVMTNMDEGICGAVRLFCENELHCVENAKEFPLETDVLITHGLGVSFFLLRLDVFFREASIFSVFHEDGFLHSVVPYNFFNVHIRYRRGHSFIFDTQGIFLNAHAPSALERMLASDFVLTDGQRHRAERAIQRLLESNLSKYNHQPVQPVSLGEGGRKKVLVIDQVYGDKSIAFGMADDDVTFTAMLQAAIDENPDADIWVKTHPASSLGHYGNFPIREYANVHYLDTPMNSIALLKGVDEVYVCTSQMGFEAVLCDKVVHVFGMPFYAGWGVTKDRMKCPRRTHRRSKEEVFWGAYIWYSHYVSFEKGTTCEIEDVMDELIRLRTEYFAESAEAGV